MKNKNRIIVWIDSLLNELSKRNDTYGIEILHSCGGECSQLSPLLDGAKKIQNMFKEEQNPDTLFNAFKTEYYNSSRLTKQGNEITLIFEECTCHLVKVGISNAFLCNCTVGYTKRIFETLFNKKVNVELKQSVLRGNTICEQVVRLE